MLRATVLTLGLALVLATSAMAQVTLTHRPQENKAYINDANVQVEQKLNIAGMDVPTSSNTHVVTRSTAGSRDANGDIRVEQKIENMQVNITVGGNEYVFDSNNPDKAGSSLLENLGIRNIHKASMKNVTTIVYDKDNQISKVELKEDILHALPVQLQDLVRTQLDPEVIKKKAVEEMGQLPSQPVKVGDTWERTEASDFGGGQTMTFEVVYKYEGTVQKEGKTLDKITMKTKSVKYDLQPGGGQPLTLKGSKLAIADSSGTVLFDRESGRSVDSQSSVRITGDIDFEINGQALPAKLDLKISSSTTAKPA